jgi:plasmid stability protein
MTAESTDRFHGIYNCLNGSDINANAAAEISPGTAAFWLENDINDSTLSGMPQLLVRNLDEAVVKRLRQRAASQGLSVEEAHRRLLRDVLLSPSGSGPAKSFKDHVLKMPAVGEDTDFVLGRGVNRPFPSV